MLPPLLGLALATEPTPWGTGRFVVDLHPVYAQLGVRYQEILATTMGGETASPVFGPTVAEADVYWRFATWDPDGMQLPEDAARRWRDTALSGTTLALNRLLDDTLAGAPQLALYRTLVDSVLHPNVVIAKSRRDGVQIEHQTGGREAQRVRSAEESANVRVPANRMPRVGVGVDWNVRDEDAPPKSPLIEYGGWLAMSNVGITSLRVDATITHPGWSLSAREQVYPRVYLYTNAHSGESTFAPSRVAVGLLWTMPTEADWSLRFERATTLPEDDTTWTLSLRGELHTPIPARPGVPLGEGGLCFPELPDHGPNQVAPLPPPADAQDWRGCDRRSGG